MPKVKTEWKSTKANPDEEHLKAEWNEEVKNLERSLAHTEEASKRRKAKTEPLIRAAGFNHADIDKLLKEGRGLSKKSLAEDESKLVKSPFDIDVLHEKDLKLARANAELIKGPGNPSWSGYIWNPSYGGNWMNWNGETEEIPSVVVDPAHKRIDPRAQTWGEGWWDWDYSQVHAYLAFTFRPPSWGHLHISMYPWLHGYYSLYSDDNWYNTVYARAEIDTWAQVHQNFWRARQYQRRFTMGGYELHPTRADRIDRQYGVQYYTNVGENDTVTIRIGVRLYCQAASSGGRSLLNFQAGSANYVYIPYVYWYLHH
ncbi:MAG: hypothetical protein V3W18_08345 [candidate division Zixibacteria bacterium]